MHSTPKDYYSDMGHNLVKVFHKQSLPDFVKNATQSSQEELNSLPDAAFADKTARKLPLHTPEDTYISAVYEKRCNGGDPERMATIEKAASFWSILDAVNSIPTEEQVEDKGRPNTWQIKYASENGITFSAEGEGLESLREASEVLHRSREMNEMPFTDRVKVGIKLASEFAKLDQSAGKSELPFALGALTCSNLPNPETICRHLYARSAHTSDKVAAMSLVKLAMELESSTDRTLSDYRELAESIDSFDEKYNLRYLYKKAFPNAHETVFNTKRAEAVDQCGVVDIGGHKYSAHELSKLSDSFLSSITSKHRDCVNTSDKVAYIQSLSKEEQRALLPYLEYILG